jgi:hypothetical protein
MSWSWRRAVAVWAALLAFIAVTTGALDGGWANVYRLARHGVAAAGTVRELDLQDHGGCGYSYVVGERTYGGSENGCGDGRRVGDPLPVYYLVDDPTVSTTVTPGLGSLVSPVGFVLLAPVLMGAFAGAGGARRRRLQP